ncbi:MAG: aminopeptidase P family protein [Bacteroidales bacterium]
MDSKETLLRKKLADLGCAAIIVPTNDPHFGEYTQDYYKTREWYSGFTGSAGTLVVTTDTAALWTDSRYFVQAAKELQGGHVQLMKLKMPNTPTIEQWIINKYSQGVKVAIDKALFSYDEYLNLKKSLSPCMVELINDPFNSVWIDRQPLKFNTIESLPTEYSGEKTKSKYSRVINLLGVYNAPFIYVVSACDEVAWLCNIRGTDIEYNPLVQSYAVVTNTAIHLFINIDSLSETARTTLLEQGVELHPYTSFENFLSKVPTNYIRICSTSKITVRDYNALNVEGAEFMDDPILGGTINHLKSIKNDTEIAGFKKAFLVDGIAWCKLLKFIEDNLAKNVLEELNEYMIGEKLIEFRKQIPEYKGESFEPIVAFGAAAALPHYSATKTSSQKVGDNNFLLMDTGAQFVFGTTDTTRTIPIGNLTNEQKRHYTLVLKGMIDLSMAKFPRGTRGSQLDILARGPLFNDGLMYFHGTCHGIGHYLCVHEGPQSVRMEENLVTLKPGMVISNEPAIYFDGKYGIRTENAILVENWKTTQFNDFYQFNTLTLVPIATGCVQKELLTTEELEWLNKYNAHVYKTLAPHLDIKTAEWLAKFIN